LRPIVIDTDPGIDDALALLFAWGSPELRVEAVTTVAGNVPLEVATTNVFRLLELRRPDLIPRVAAGVAQPLARPLMTAVRYHGKDGLGDLTDWPPVEARLIAGEATGVLIGAAGRHRERLTLVAIGPLTNLALALEADRDTLRRIGRIVSMGGAVDVPGNVTPTAEFNFNVDPDAARCVFGAGLNLDLVPLDATRQAVLSRSELEVTLAKSPGPLAARIAAFSARGFRVDTERGERGMILHDPLAIGVAIDPTLSTWEPVRLEIGPEGETRRIPGIPNCRIAQAVDTPRFITMLLGRLCPASS